MNDATAFTCWRLSVVYQGPAVPFGIASFTVRSPRSIPWPPNGMDLFDLDLLAGRRLEAEYDVPARYGTLIAAIPMAEPAEPGDPPP